MCAHWQPDEVARDTPAAPPREARKVVVDAKLSREHVGMMSRAPTGQQSERYAAQLLAVIVGDATGSRLFYALVDPAIAEEASMGYEPLDHAGAFVTALCASPDRAAEAVGIAREELRKFQDEGPTEAEIQAAKNKIATGATRAGELPMNRLTAVGLFAVTRREVLAVAREYDLTATTMLALGPVETL